MQETAQLLQSSVVGERGIQSDQIFHRDFRATERQRKSVIRFRVRERDARALQKLIKRRVRQFGGERYGGNITAARERVGRAVRAEKFAIEIFRIVIAETVRRVLQQRERMNLPLIKRECIDERLQGRTG